MYCATASLSNQAGNMHMPSQEQQTLPRIVTLAEIEEIVSTREFAIQLIDAIKSGFVSYSSGEFNACPIQTMGAPPMAPFGDKNDRNNGNNYAAQTCVKSGYVTAASHYVIKVAVGGSPFPTNSGLMQLYSQRTGKLETILMDEGLLTELAPPPLVQLLRKCWPRISIIRSTRISECWGLVFRRGINSNISNMLLNVGMSWYGEEHKEM
mmetsp:Transcript_31155/g.75316  ORF Transcript_31155/g.75316 Transcript_31155/m.75316 type:complete len:209 (+) Transcript_31155:40-666(+)